MMFRKASYSAKVVDGKLILSFPQAARPILWHMDLAETRSCAFEIRESEAVKGQFSLLLKRDKESDQEIASFKDIQSATEALMAVSSALEKTRNYQLPAAGTATMQPVGAQESGGSFLKVAGAILGVFILLILSGMLWSMSPRAPASLKSASTSDLRASAQKSAKENIGQPMSADDFLMGR